MLWKCCAISAQIYQDLTGCRLFVGTDLEIKCM